jgi:AcrR family transcriptional regulator
MMERPASPQQTGASDIADQTTPALLTRLWRLPITSRRGRPAELDIDKVVLTAIELADRHGLAEATLPKVAKVLGFTPMSLYRYVGSKGELLILMQDLALGDPPALGSAAADWRDGLALWATAGRELTTRRPWLARIPVSGPPSGPHEIAWMEAGLRVLQDTCLDWAQKVDSLTLLDGFIRQAALLSQDLAHGRDGTGRTQADVERDYGRHLAELVDPDQHPQTAQMLRSGLFEATPDQVGSDDHFTFGLERILDGIAAIIDP